MVLSVRKIILALLFVALSVIPCGGRVRVAFVGDPQVDNASELEYARRSVYRELRERRDIDFAVFLGDIVNGKPGLLPPSKESLDSLPFPYYCIPGNHDDTDTFRKVFGYTDTTFVKSGIQFIFLDNSSGRLDAGHLERMISAGDNRRKVVCTHIPLKFCRDSSLLAVAGHPEVLLVSAHLHRVFRSEASDGVEEIGAGASCGSWWRGVKTDGIPYALMNCGSPRGYFVADFFSGGKYSLKYKAIGSNDVASATVVGDSLKVNVYGGHSSGEVAVSYRNGHGKQRLRMRHSGTMAPEVAETLERNNSVSREYRRSHKDEFIPLRRLPSPHLWSCPLPSGAVSGVVTVRYRDAYMKFCRRVRVRANGNNPDISGQAR